MYVWLPFTLALEPQLAELLATFASMVAYAHQDIALAVSGKRTPGDHRVIMLAVPAPMYSLLTSASSGSGCPAVMWSKLKMRLCCVVQFLLSCNSSCHLPTRQIALSQSHEYPGCIMYLNVSIG